jgi:hypothetical protein
MIRVAITADADHAIRSTLPDGASLCSVQRHDGEFLSTSRWSSSTASRPCAAPRELQRRHPAACGIGGPDGGPKRPLNSSLKAFAFPSALTPSGRRASIGAAFLSPRRAHHEAADHKFLRWRRSRARRRAGGKPGAGGTGLSSGPVRKLAGRSFWTSRGNHSVSTAGRCRSFRISGRSRPAGRLLRWARLTHFSQSGGGQAGARPLRSPSSRRAAVRFGRSGRDEGPVVILRHEAAETALGPRWPCR